MLIDCQWDNILCFVLGVLIHWSNINCMSQNKKKNVLLCHRVTKLIMFQLGVLPVLHLNQGLNVETWSRSRECKHWVHRTYISALLVFFWSKALSWTSNSDWLCQRFLVKSLPPFPVCNCCWLGNYKYICKEVHDYFLTNPHPSLLPFTQCYTLGIRQEVKTPRGMIKGMVGEEVSGLPWLLFWCCH